MKYAILFAVLAASIVMPGAAYSQSSRPYRTPNSAVSPEDNACALAGVYAQMNSTDEEMKPLVALCSRNDDQKICQMTLDAIRAEGKGDRGLVCRGS